MSTNEKPLTANQINANNVVEAGISSAATASELIGRLGRGGHLALSGAVKRLGLKASKPGVTKGKYIAYDADTTFSRA